MGETPPPLRVRESDGSPSLIPTYIMTFSGATLTRRGPTEMLISMDSGASGGGAPTDAAYVTYAADATLSAERIIASGSSATIVTDGTNVFVNALTGGFATSARVITTLFPLSGGANLSADRTFAADTAFLINSGRTISFGSGFLVGGGNLSADRSITYGLPIGVGTGGTGVTTFTNRGFLIGSGASAIETLAAMVQGQLVVGSSAVLAPQFLNVGSAGQVLGINNAVPLSISWVDTIAAGASTTIYAPTGGQYITYAANNTLTAERILTAGSSITIVTDGTNIYVTAITNAGGSTTKTVFIPMALMTVQPDSANAFWMSTTGTNLDYSFVRFVDSGEGIATYWGRVPFNLAATPAWNLRFYSKTGAAAAGTAIITTRARSITDAEDIDLAYTIVSSAAPYLIRSANLLTISAVSGGNFDSVVGTSAGDLLMVEINRHGGDTNDVLSNGWDLMGVDMRVDVS